MGEDTYGINREVIDRIVAEIGEVHAARRRDRRRDRRRQHLPRRRARRRGHGPRDRRLHGHAGDADERARAAGRAAPRRRRVARAVGAAHRPGRRALHPRPGAAPPRGAQGRHLRRGHRQSVLHDGHRRGAARARDGRRHRAEGDQGRRRLHGRPEEGPDGDALRRAHVRRGDRQESQGDGRDGARAVPRPEHAAQGVLDLRARRAEARRAWAGTRARSSIARTRRGRGFAAAGRAPEAPSIARRR